MAKPTISYAQRFEDIYLMRCFGSRSDGFYIDIGSGHPVYDNVSFAFYLEGWHGVTVEPNPDSRAAEQSDPAARSPRRGAPRRKRRRGHVLSGRGFSRPLDHDRGPCSRGAPAIRKSLAGHGHAGHDIAGAVPATRAARVRLPQGRRRRRRAGGSARRRLAELSAEGGRGRGACALHPRAGLAGMGAVSRQTRLSLCLVRQPQPLLPRRGGKRARALFRDRTAHVRGGVSVPNRQAGARRRLAIPIIGWPSCWPATT